MARVEYDSNYPVMKNLVANAIKFAPKGKEVKIERALKKRVRNYKLIVKRTHSCAMIY